jgi:hypothetical protein
VPKGGMKPSQVLAIMQPLLTIQAPGQEFLSVTINQKDPTKVNFAIKINTNYIFNCEDCFDFINLISQKGFEVRQSAEI